jgi:pseudaminic acid cytidylyltransferase
MNLCVIPARGGSKRIPRKNIKMFHGKPIIAYSIEAALKSNIFDEVMVSTDDEQIKQIAKNYGAKVPFMRSDKNSDDLATTFEVLEEVINGYKAVGTFYEKIGCLYPCAPFVTAEKLIQASKEMKDTGAKSIFPIVKYSYPVQRALKMEATNVVYENPEFKNSRSQDLEARYHDAGQFYMMNTAVVLQKQEIVGVNSVALVVDELEVQDIDTMRDWKLAELKYQLLNP